MPIYGCINYFWNLILYLFTSDKSSDLYIASCQVKMDFMQNIAFSSGFQMTKVKISFWLFIEFY